MNDENLHKDRLRAYTVDTLYDGRGSEPIHKATILVRGAEIVDVLDSHQVPAEAEHISMDACTALPGLVDAHVHFVWGAEGVPHEQVDRDTTERTLLRMVARARRTLQRGTTTVRDLGATAGLSIPLAAAVNDGDIEGPRIVAAGRAIAMTGGHAWQITVEADGPDRIRQAVRQEIKLGAGAIKLMASGGVYDERAGVEQSQLTVEEMAAAVEEAHKAGVKVAAHAYTPGPIGLALDAGVDSIEHGSFLDRPTAERMAREGVYFVPTAMASELIVRNADTLGTPPHMRAKGNAVRSAVRQAIRIAREAGTPIAAGTDSGGAGIDHGTLFEEAAILHDCGFTVAEVIKLCTLAGAELCGVAGVVGSLEKGKQADVLFVEGDLNAGLHNLRRVRTVLRQGRTVSVEPGAHTLVLA